MVIAGKVRDDCLCEYSELVDQVLVLIESIRSGAVIRCGLILCMIAYAAWKAHFEATL